VAPAPAPVAAPARAPVAEPAAVAAPATVPTRSYAPSFSSSIDAEPADTVAPRYARPSAKPRYDYIRVGIGFRVGIVPNAGLDAFAKDDVLTQGSIDASYAFFTKGKLAISAGAAWDSGDRSSGARGLGTHLGVNRLTVPIEARWYFAPWFNAFAKVAPGAAAFSARVSDSSSPAKLEDTSWVFATDLSAGASLRLLGRNDHAERSPRLWLTQEVGYGMTGEHGIRLQPSRNEEDVLGSDQSTRFGSLALNGVFFRTSVAMTF
jgi:hypothetical protein